MRWDVLEQDRKGQAASIHRQPLSTPTSVPRPPNYPLIYPKYPRLRAIRTLLKCPWGVRRAIVSSPAAVQHGNYNQGQPRTM